MNTTIDAAPCGCRQQSRSNGVPKEYEQELSPTRLFSCTGAELAQVRAVVGRDLSAAEARAALDAAVHQARREATAAARALRSHPRSAKTTSTFRGVFNVPPTFVPDWRPADARWHDLGELVGIRIDNAARILAGGYMRYFCWGSAAHCPQCQESPPSYRACSSSENRYHICLGEEWWQWHRARRRGHMASTLLHEAFHIYFSYEHVPADRRRVRRPTVGSIYCYDVLVARLHGCSPKPKDEERCKEGY